MEKLRELCNKLIQNPKWVATSTCTPATLVLTEPNPNGGGGLRVSVRKSPHYRYGEFVQIAVEKSFEERDPKSPLWSAVYQDGERMEWDSYDYPELRSLFFRVWDTAVGRLGDIKAGKTLSLLGNLI